MNIRHHRFMRMNPENGSCTTGASLSILEHNRMRGRFDSPYTELVELVPTPDGLRDDEHVIAVIRRVEWPEGAA